MASLGSISNIALSSLQASQLGISVASNNISNAQNPNYTEERLVTVPGQSSGSDPNLGTGVDIVGVQAVRDTLIGSRILQENSSSSGANILNQTLSNVQVQFTDTTNTGLLQSMSSFFNSFQTLAADPASPDSRVAVQAAGQALASNFNSIHDSLVTTQTQANQTVSQNVADINSLASQIAQINGEITAQQANGTPNGLIDQREGLVTQLSSIANVHELDSGNGNYQLTIGNDRMLVAGTTTQPLTTGTGSNGMTTVMSGNSDITAELTGSGGELGANLDIRDNYVPKYLNSLDQLASAIVQHVNSASSAGYDLNGNTGINFFQPLAGVSGASGALALSTQVAADPSTIAASSDPSGQDNGTATQIGNLLFQPVFSGGAVTDQYQSMVFTVGSDVSNSTSSMQQHQALLQQLQTQQQSVSGVSTDEETMNLLQFQRSYQASARVISTVDQLTQTLLAMQAT
jgi:flagellar hook-associated protein 1